VTALRLEGVGPSVAHRRQSLHTLLKGFGALATLDEAASKSFWKAVRDVQVFAADDRVIWRISTAPTRGHEITAAMGEGAYYYDWAGGLIWLALPPSDDAGAALVRRATAASGGHATLMRAPAAVRAVVPVFEPQDAGVAALTRRIKESFDPQGVLNAGRMYAGV
jgi:glycolate oxidase FAD binding subunit